MDNRKGDASRKTPEAHEPPQGHEIPEVPVEHEEGPEGWVVLREVQDPMQAQLITGLLRSGGLDVQVENRVFSQEPVPIVRSFSRVLLWVPTGQLEQAERVLAESEDRPSNACPTCGRQMEDDVCGYCIETGGGRPA